MRGDGLFYDCRKADSSFIPATFFIKYLATCDLLFSASTFVKIFDFMPVVVVSSFTTFFIKMSVHVTLALAVSSNLLIGINSSINVIYYVIFASEFRRLLVLRFTRLWGCCKRRYAGY
nr:hypothetical protein BaRGS_015600 [Batillaria attramentaria]